MKHYGGGGSRQFLVHYKWVSQEMVHNNDIDIYFPFICAVLCCFCPKTVESFWSHFFLLKQRCSSAFIFIFVFCYMYLPLYSLT